MTHYKPLPPVIELQNMRRILMGQMEHVRRHEAAGMNRDFEREYLDSKVNALDRAIEALSPGLLGALQYNGGALEPLELPLFLQQREAASGQHL